MLNASASIPNNVNVELKGLETLNITGVFNLPVSKTQVAGFYFISIVDRSTGDAVFSIDSSSDKVIVNGHSFSFSLETNDTLTYNKTYDVEFDSGG
jgi:hypothetical protein